jgi:hypothetical protein
VPKKPAAAPIVGRYDAKAAKVPDPKKQTEIVTKKQPEIIPEKKKQACPKNPAAAPIVGRYV